MNGRGRVHHDARSGAMVEGLTSEEAAFRSELASANINPDSFLATDYLNHFNEIVMLLEMAMDMPDLMEEAVGWKPASYVEHFQNSGFVARELVVKAWDMTSPGVRAQFENVVSQLDSLILSVLDMLKDAGTSDGAFDKETRVIADSAQITMQDHLAMLNTIIHHGSESAASEPVETGASLDEVAGSSEAQSQDEIDQLFD